MVRGSSDLRPLEAVEARQRRDDPVAGGYCHRQTPATVIQSLYGSLDTEGAIALVTEEHHMPYQRPPLSKGYLTGKEGLDHVYLKEDAHYIAGEQRAYRELPYFFSDLFDFSYEVWGDLTAWDETVLRGSIETGSFALYYFDQGHMVGVLTAGRPGKERKPMQALVGARPPYEDVVARLSDEGVDLATWV